jgi:hypothetical protein
MNNDFLKQSHVSIKGIDETVVDRYFLSLNEGDFISVSELFSVEGCLCPPFEKKIFGRDSIASYLQAEAKGMKAFPEFGTLNYSGDESTVYQVMGTVKTSFFLVNVCWKIQVNSQKEIISVEVKLLAELQDLLSLKRR